MTGKTVSIPLRGSSSCNLTQSEEARQYQTIMSQSPYGAQALATRGLTGSRSPESCGRNPLTGLKLLQLRLRLRLRPRSRRRNPLTGLKLLQPSGRTPTRLPSCSSRNPLTGLKLLQRGKVVVNARPLLKSQSPYGAQALATWFMRKGGPGEAAPVAIPLRGSSSCNSTPLRTPSWTALPEGGVCEKDEAWNMHTANNGGF